jgi:crotonobetainyl-CoA hydratase
MFTPKSGFGGITERFSLNKPVIAAVNGFAFGGGFEIALACDLVVASRNAVFGLPEPRVGRAALAGGIQRLQQELGRKRAAGILLTGRRVSAEEGYELGFVNEVVEQDVLGAARRWADEIMACGPLSIRATKETMNRWDGGVLQSALTEQWDYPATKTMLGSEDSIEGPTAFSEKRAPRWQGR